MELKIDITDKYALGEQEMQDLSQIGEDELQGELQSLFPEEDVNLADFEIAQTIQLIYSCKIIKRK